MICERSIFLMLCWRWKKRIGFRLDMSSRAFDPEMEINSHLLPNDHLEARPVFMHGLVTSYRSLVWPFTPVLGLRFLATATRGVAHASATENLLSKGV